jgi:hypothetical protein
MHVMAVMDVLEHWADYNTLVWARKPKFHGRRNGKLQQDRQHRAEAQ